MHVHILGATGRNKTHRIAVPLCCQLLRIGGRTIVYADLKGDDAAFWTLCECARALGLPVYFFSLDKSEASHLMNLLTDPAFVALDDNQQAQLIAQAAALAAGEGFGEGYYGAMNEMLIKRLLQIFKRTGRPMSWRGLKNFVADRSIRTDLGMTRRDFENSSHSFGIFDKLGDDPRTNMLGTEPVDPRIFESAIVVDKAIEGPCLIYLKLPASLEPTTARIVPRMLIRLLHSRLATWRGPRVERVHFVLDEAQEALQRALLTPIKQGRSAGLSFIVVHQNVSDLAREGADFPGAVLANTAVKIVMSAKDPEGRDMLVNSSGERLEAFKSTSESKTSSDTGTAKSEGTQTRDVAVPNIGQNEVNWLNANSELAVLEASPRSGFTQIDKPTIIEVPFTMSEKEFEKLDSYEWPSPDGVMRILGTDLPPLPAPPPPAPSRGSRQEPRGSGKKRRREPKPPDPEQEQRSADLAERLRNTRKQK